MQQFRKVSRTRTIIALKHIQATLYLKRSEMGSQCSFSRRGVECWWRGAKRTSCSKVLNFLERLDDTDRIETGTGGILEDKAMFSVLLF